MLVLLSVVDGESNEAVKEAETFGDALRICREANAELTSWRAMTILHIEDLPPLLEGAEQTDAPRPDQE